MQDDVDNFSDKDVGHGATDKEIKHAEHLLGLPIRGTFRSFLETWGWGRFSHIIILGVGSSTPDYASLVRHTQEERQLMEPPLPYHLLPIANDGAGNHYCIDTSADSLSDTPVVFWDHELGREQILEFVSPGFSAWLTALLQELSQGVDEAAT